MLHLVGGGCKNLLLNQFTADAIARPVQTGPVEATALGNIMGQALATGAVGSLAEARDIIRNSTETHIYNPKNSQVWEEAYARFRKLA
jgi:rhamnulokinase